MDFDEKTKYVLLNMNKTTIYDEVNALGVMRTQDVYGLNERVLVIELYSHEHKRLYFIFDQNPQSYAFHVQKNKPEGLKTISPVILQLRKNIKDKPLWFLAKDQVARAIVEGQEVQWVLLFSLYPHKIELINEQSRILLPKASRGTSLSVNLLQAEKYQKIIKKNQAEKIYQGKIKDITSSIKKNKKLLSNLDKDLDAAQAVLKREQDVELLKLNMHKIKKGMKNVDIMDYSTYPASARTITIDDTMSAQAYVEKEFNRIKRAKRGMSYIGLRKETVKKNIAVLEKELDKIREQGPELFYDVALFKGPAKKPSNTQKRKCFKSFLSSDNIQILVGRSAKDNDELLLHHTRGNDWWFHLRAGAGSHVVVKNQGELLQNTLLEAAMLAAHYSSAREETLPEVIYTQAKYVKKIKGSLPGKVIITQEKSLVVRMDQKKITMLLERKVD